MLVAVNHLLSPPKHALRLPGFYGIPHSSDGANASMSMSGYGNDSEIIGQISAKALLPYPACQSAPSCNTGGEARLWTELRLSSRVLESIRKYRRKDRVSWRALRPDSRKGNRGRPKVPDYDTKVHDDY